MIKVKIKRLNAGAIMPTYGSSGAACFDLYSMTDGHVGMIPVMLDTGLAFEIPEGYVMLVFSRSGHGFKDGVRLINCVGVIDHDYRGAVKVKLHKDTYGSGLDIKKGDRIAQAMIVPFPKVGFEWSDELSDTERGVGGFGSTGQ